MIRPVNVDTDAKRIVDIYNNYILKTTVSFETEPLTAEQMRKRIEQISAIYPYLVYEENGRVIGYAYVHMWKERVAYCHTVETTIYIASDCLHKGAGSALMARLISECRKKNYRMLIACVTGENLPSIEFHKKLGFNIVSHFHNVGNKLGRWLDVVDLELDITKENQTEQ